MRWEVLVLVVIGYLTGSIPFSLFFTKIFSKGKIDITKEGTGNTGTENAWIVGGWVCGLFTGLFDMSKGLVAVLIASFWLGWTFTDNTMAMMLLSIPAWVGHCFPVWLKFKGGMGAGIIYGYRLYVGGPIVWLMGQIFFVPNIFVKNSYKKIAFNHVMALGVNLIGGLIFLSLNYIDLGYLSWGFFNLIDQPILNYTAVFQVSLIWIGMYMIRRCIGTNFIADLKAGLPLWRSLWTRILFEAWPKDTTYDFPNKEFMLTDEMIFRKKNKA